MPKYKNITQFTRPVVINGKRLALKPGEIVFSDRELDASIYTFLGPVDNDAKVSQVKELRSSQQKVANHQTVQAVQKQIVEVKQTVDAIAKAGPEKTKSLEEKLAKVEEQNALILKRLEAMKGAVEIVHKNQEEMTGIVHDLEHEVYENGAIVIEGLDAEPEAKKE